MTSLPSQAMAGPRDDSPYLRCDIGWGEPTCSLCASGSPSISLEGVAGRFHLKGNAAPAARVEECARAAAELQERAETAEQETMALGRKAIAQQKRAESAESRAASLLSLNAELRKDIKRLHGLIELLASAYRGFLPHENAPGEFHSSNDALSSGTRTRLALIEDTIKDADAVLSRAEKAVRP